MSEPASSEIVSREVFLAAFLRYPRGVAWATHRLALAMRDVHVPAGQALYRIGDPPTHHYFVVSGEVALSAPEMATTTLRERSIIGIFDVTLQRPRTRDATATAPSHLLEMPGAEWYALLRDAFAFAHVVMQAVAGRVHALRRRPPPLGSFDPPRGAVVARGPATDIVDRMLLLREAAPMRSGGAQALASLAALAEEIRLEAGAVLTPPGTRPCRLFFVVSGEIEAALDGQESTGRFRAGALVSGMASVDASLVCEARATCPSAVLAIALEDFFDVMEEHFALTQATLKAIAEEHELLLNRA